MECELVKSKKRFWTKNEKTHGNNQHWINIRTKHVETYMYITVYIYIYTYVHALFLHAVVHVDQHSSVFPLVHQEISSVCLTCWIIWSKELISFPNLFDQFIKKTCFPPICSFYHLVSSAVPNFPNLFLQFIITVFLQFSKVFPTY